MTVEQSIVLAELDREHGKVRRLPDDSALGEHLLSHSVTDTRAYLCANCNLAFTIEPDGDTTVWALLHDTET